jgi:DNA-binding transcriptional ArsR family regulator
VRLCAFGEFDISPVNLVHHMKTLCEAEIVNCRREGKWMHTLSVARGSKRLIVCYPSLPKRRNNAMQIKNAANKRAEDYDADHYRRSLGYMNRSLTIVQLR